MSRANRKRSAQRRAGIVRKAKLGGRLMWWYMREAPPAQSVKWSDLGLTAEESKRINALSNALRRWPAGQVELHKHPRWRLR